jgi:hypothetical protein
MPPSLLSALTVKQLRQRLPQQFALPSGSLKLLQLTSRRVGSDRVQVRWVEDGVTANCCSHSAATVEHALRCHRSPTATIVLMTAR